MLVAVKRLREIKSFTFLFKSCGAGFVANVGRESVPKLHLGMLIVRTKD